MRRRFVMATLALLLVGATGNCRGYWYASPPELTLAAPRGGSAEGRVDICNGTNRTSKYEQANIGAPDFTIVGGGGVLDLELQPTECHTLTVAFHPTDVTPDPATATLRALVFLGRDYHPEVEVPLYGTIEAPDTGDTGVDTGDTGTDTGDTGDGDTGSSGPDCSQPLEVTLEVVSPTEQCAFTQEVDGVVYPGIEVATSQAQLSVHSSHAVALMEWDLLVQDLTAPDYQPSTLGNPTVTFPVSLIAVAVRITDTCDPARVAEDLTLLRSDDGVCP